MTTDAMERVHAHLHLHDEVTTLQYDDGRTFSMQVGPRALAEKAVRHDPPTSGEVEHVIDLIEEVLSGIGGARVNHGLLSVSDPLLQQLPGLDHPGAILDRDAVEILFQRLASRAFGRPVHEDELPHGRAIAAALLVLRECMHHLDFDQVVAVPA